MRALLNVETKQVSAGYVSTGASVFYAMAASSHVYKGIEHILTFVGGIALYAIETGATIAGGFYSSGNYTILLP